MRGGDDLKMYEMKILKIFCNSLSIRIFDTLFALSRNSLTHSKYFSKLFPSQINKHTLKNTLHTHIHLNLEILHEITS